MTLRALPVLLLALAAPLVLSASPPQLDGVEYAQLTIHERLIIRVPRVSPAPVRGRAPAKPTVRWDEKKGPECVAMAALTGASVEREGEVDLVVGGTRRLRAKLDDDCPTLDFYRGFYLKPTADGQLCARRDGIRSRSGAYCAVTRFRTLVPRKVGK
ncbi:hypothetical protein [Sphingomonas phyllosphaerae]|jgi:hypothetical protein|uniref:hypothetical protein n=1 Tax=Sphingomonas phyllosphaerae TaxID=257003 RepID=UPI0003B32AC9|nr:hypothetical protein [Sphingomonas phyllosphaerae]